MSNQQYQHLLELIELVQKTGDRCLVLPSNEGKPLVLLTLDSYKELLEKQQSQVNLQIDELAKQLRNYIESNQKSEQLSSINQNPAKRHPNKDENYTNIEEFEIKRRLYADLMDGYKSEPIFR